MKTILLQITDVCFWGYKT